MRIFPGQLLGELNTLMGLMECTAWRQGQADLSLR